MSIELTERYQVLPSMPPEQFEALKADIAERGVLTPIDVDEHGNILDGHHRYRACVELGVTDFPTVVRPGLSEEDRRMFARKSNMLRRHLSREQVRYLIAEQLKDAPSWADNRIAQALGVDGKTVRTVRRKLEATSEIPKLDRLIGSDGKERPVQQKRPPAIMAADTGELERILEQLGKADGERTVAETLAAAMGGFVTEQGIAVFTCPAYDPFEHCDDAGAREWHLFLLFLISIGTDPEGAQHHVEWILRREYRTPDEWLDDDGFRRRWGMRNSPRKYVRRWAEFRDARSNMALKDIQRELEAS